MATSSAPDLSKEALSKLLTCAICLDHYKDPRMLPCAHTYCEGCISRLPVERPNEQQRVVKCPLCQQLAQLGEKGSSGLPIAFHINQIDELSKKVHTLGKGNVDEHKQQTRPAKNRIDEVEQVLALFEAKEKEMIELEEAVHKDIDNAYQALMRKLHESRMRLLQEATASLQEKMKLHLLQKANVETVLSKMKSCKEEESLSQPKSAKTDEFKCEMQADPDMKQLSIINTHSEQVKVSEFRPTQELNIMFIMDKNALSACGHIGDISSKQLSSSFSVDLPTRILVDIQTMPVAIKGPISLEASRLSCKLYFPGGGDFHSICPVTSVGEGQFKVMIQSNSVGLHQLRVLVDGVDIYGSPFSVHVVEWRKIRNLYKFASLGSPWDVAVTDDGQYVVVTECAGNCVTVLSKPNWHSGQIVRNFSGFGGRLIHPKSLALSADCKNIFVATETGIEKYCLLTSAYEGSHTIDCARLTLHPVSGKVYCIDRAKENITVLNDDLTSSHVLNIKMASSVLPTDLAIDSKGMLYFVSSSGVVLKFTPEGEYYATIGSAGDQDYQFGKPGCICINSNDIMYVTDIQKCHIMMFTTEGDYLKNLCAYAESTSVPKCELHGVAVDKTGNVFVCNSNKQVLFFPHN